MNSKTPLRTALRLPALFVGGLMIAACGNSDTDDWAAPHPGEESTAAASPETVIENYVRISEATLTDALDAARELHASVERFLQDPDEQSLEAARAAWKSSRAPFLQAEALFALHPESATQDSPRPALSAWPVNAGFIDYSANDPNAGIINDPGNFPEISADVLVELAESGEASGVVMGYHVVEFLLWGQDLEPGRAGERSPADYIADETGPGKNAARRSQFLSATAGLLVNDLEQLRTEWVPDTGRESAAMLERNPRVALEEIFSGMNAVLEFELPVECLLVPFETKAAEDERSAFSNHTRTDLVAMVRGVQNVYLGRIIRRDGTHMEGPGINDLVLDKDPELAAHIELQLRELIEGIKQIPEPFETAIAGDDTSPGRSAIAAVIAKTKTLAESMTAAAALIIERDSGP